MKKLIFVLAVLLLAIPSWAGITVSATADGNEVTISYQMDGDDANLPRAFGLDVSVSGAVIVSGPVVNVNDYYVAPGTYEYDPCTPNDVNWGDPVVGLTATGFTLEAGSLYDDSDPCHPIAPDSNGWLCKFYLDTDTGFYVDLEENAARAGVVMEDTEKVWPPGYVVLEDANVGQDECFNSGHADYAYWKDPNVGEPLCFCYKRQCYGDADGKYQGTDYFGYWFVGTDDAGVLLAAWQELEDCNQIFGEGSLNCDQWMGGPPTPSGDGLGTYDDPIVIGPAPANVPGICADFERNLEGTPFFGYWRVGTSDNALLLANWQELEDCWELTGGPCVQWMGGPNTPSGEGLPTDQCGGILDPE